MPTMNDLKYKEYRHLRHIQRNHFKKEYVKNLVSF